jgi:TonB family protein
MDWRLFAFPLLAGFFAWNLWRAFATGGIASRTGIVSRGHSPVVFWLLVATSSLALVLMGVASGIAVYQALHPRPLADRLADLYPRAALRQKLEGYAVVGCTLTASYGLKDCQVISESPPDVGFGPAAVRMAQLMILPAGDRANARPGAVIRLPIRFKLPNGKP